MVLWRLQWENLRAFLQQEVLYWGHLVSDKGVFTNLSKIEAVANWQHPTPTSEVALFVDFASYSRCFVEGFAI